MEEIISDLKGGLEACERLLVGIGAEWQLADKEERKKAYEKLKKLVDGKDYFVITSLTDGALYYESGLDKDRIAAPCGNQRWKQCEKACTKDIWEEDEVPDGICPHCGAALIGNTIESENYIEEGYMPQWAAYKTWLTRTLNKKIVILELGENFKTPTVIRWPFEKTAFFNQKSSFYRVNERFSQLSEELKGKATAIPVNSVEFLNFVC